MRNIVLTRIDDRLIHGEVITGWLPVVNATRIYIVDDKAASDPFTCRVLKASAPRHIPCFIYPADEAAEKLLAQGSAKERLVILVRSPLTLEHLMKKGVFFDRINLGGVGPAEDRMPFFRNVFLSREEISACEYMMAEGSRIYYQLVPELRRFEITDVIRQMKEKAEGQE